SSSQWFHFLSRRRHRCVLRRSDNSDNRVRIKGMIVLREFVGNRDFKDISMTFSLKAIFQRDDRYEGVRRIHIYLLRLVFILMFFVLGKDTWTNILTHKGPWDPTAAVAWCVWTAFATLAGLGIIRPLKMLPILLLEIFYKVLWLVIVAYPLWSKG